MILAFMFAAPWLLPAVGLATAPVIIHLLNKQRFRRMEWAAMQWLLAAIRKNQRRLRMEQWLLLALRTLLVLLLVLAMARPMLEQSGFAFAGRSSSTHDIMVIDHSMSMHYRGVRGSRWEQAKTTASAILEDAQAGDTASVVLMGVPSTILVGDPSPYLKDVAREIDNLKPRHGAGTVEAAFDLIGTILKNPAAARRRIYLLTDMQRSSWLGPNRTVDTAALNEKLQAVSQVADVSIIDLGQGENNNLAVTQVEQIDPLATVGRPVVIRAAVTNNGTVNITGLPVELVIDGQVEATQTLDVPAGDTRSTYFSFAFRQPGDRAVAARIPDDALRPDNQRHLVVRVRQSVSVLLIDGEISGEPFRSESDYLRVALAPAAAGEGVSSIRVERRAESDLVDVRPDEWDLIALCNVGQLTAGEAAVLEEFVRRGGGVAFFLGSLSNAASYNSVLFNEGKGLLPMAVGEVVGTAERGRDFFTFNPLQYAHPIVEPFRDAERAGLLTTKVFRYVKLKSREATSGQDRLPSIALAYNTGDPAIVMQKRGGGNVAVVTTSADLDWNTWAISPSYVPVIQELARQLVAGRVRRDSVVVGDPIVLPVERRELLDSVTFLPPAEATASDVKSASEAIAVNVKPEEIDGVWAARFPTTDISGVYRADFGASSEAKSLVAVNPPVAESDLTRFSADDLRAAFPGWNFNYSDRWEPTKLGSGTGAQQASELARPILYIVLALLLAETYLAWRFGHHR